MKRWLAGIGLSAWSLLVLRHIQEGIPWRSVLASAALYPWGFAAGALARHGARLAALLALSVLFFGTGRILLRHLKVEAAGAWEELSLASALGYAAWGTLLLLLGLAGLWHPLLLRALALAALLPASLSAAAFLRTLRVERPSAGAALCFAAALAGGAYCLRYAMVPETFYDALGYHLALPNLYLLEGRIVPVPENSYAGFPSIPSMLFGLTLAFDRWGILASMLHCSMLLWAGAAMMALARRVGRPEAGPPACLVFALTPVVFAEAFRVSVGLEWTLFEAACFLAFFGLLDAPAEGRRGWSLLCGLLLGAAMATKYTAWLLPASLVLGALAWRGERPGKGAWVLLAAAAAAVVAPWVARNLVHYGNPLYPFLHGLFAPGALHMPDTARIKAGTDWNEPLLSARWLGRWLLHPWYFLKPLEDLSRSIGPVYLSLLPVLLLVRLPERVRLLAWLGLGAWVPLSFAASLTRYFIPHLAPLAVVLLAAAAELEPRALARAAAGWAAALSVLTGAAWALLDTKTPHKIDVFLGRRDYRSYLIEGGVSYPAPPYPGLEAVNRAARPGERFVLVGDVRSFYSAVPAVAASPDQPSALEAWANREKSAEGLLSRLRGRKAAFILVNHAEVFRNRTSFRFSKAGKEAFDAFWARYTLKESETREADKWVAVYRVLGDEEAARPHPADDLFSAYRQGGTR